MIYVGMDVSSKSFVVHAIDERKNVLLKKEIAPTRQGLRELNQTLGSTSKLIVFEAGNQLKWIALFLKKMKGVYTYVVHPNEIKWISQSSGKTDKVDARKLAELARGDMLPRAVHVVDGPMRELRELISARTCLMGKRVALINTIRGNMLQEGHKLPEKFFSRVDWEIHIAKLRVGEATKAIIDAFMTSIKSLEASERELLKRIESIEDDRLELLESIPGIGKLTSRTLLSAIDDIDRFDGKKALAKYGALVPRIYQSGNVTHMGRISPAGRREIRRVLLQCAHTVAKMRSFGAFPLREFYERVEKRSGKKKAIVALARKLLTTAYGVLKSGEHYDPVMVAAPNMYA